MWKRLHVPFVVLLLASSSVMAAPPSNAIVNATGGQPLALQIVTIIRSVQSAGYPIIKSIQLKNGIYNVKVVNSQGFDVDLVVDPQQGSIIRPDKPSNIHYSIIDAITQVISKGYHGVYSVEANDGSYSVSAIDNKGNNVNLKVDAITGEVTKSWF